MILLAWRVARAEPLAVEPIVMFEGDAVYQEDEALAESGFAVRRFYLGMRVDPVERVRAVGIVDLAGEHPRILEATIQWWPLAALDLSVGHAKTPLFPSARDQQIDTTPLPELSFPVAALWPGRDLGIEAHLGSVDLPVEAWLRIGDGSGNAVGNDNPSLAADGRLDLVLGRERLGADRALDLGLRVGAGVHVQDAEDRGAVSGETLTGFAFWRAPTVSGRRTLGEAHLVADLGSVRVMAEGGSARESRSRDTDGNPDTPREPLDAVNARGVSVEAAWMVTGQHRAPESWPVDEELGIEVSARGERLWTGLGASDVAAGGARGAELGMRAWWPFGVALGVAGQALALDTAPLETPGDTFAWTLLARSTFRLR